MAPLTGTACRRNPLHLNQFFDFLLPSAQFLEADTIDFNEVLEDTGSIIAGGNGLNIAAIGTTFKINGGLVVTGPSTSGETINLLEEIQ